MKKLFASFLHALHGISNGFSNEMNCRIHGLITILVITAGWYFDISKAEWMVILLCIGLVFAMELMNTAIENLSDTLHPEKSEGIRIVKDSAAGAVLVAAGIAAICGLIIFVPKIIQSL